MKLELRRVTALTPGAADARRSWPERESLLLRLSDADGGSGAGEASPLPGYSPDELAEVEGLLKDLDISLLEAALAEPQPRTALEAVSALAPRDLPAARMALETAALDWLSRCAGVPAPTLLGAEATATRALSELVGPASAPDLVARSQQALDSGFRHIKLKLGGAGKLDQELEAVAALRERLGPDIGLRLDANGCLTAPELEIAWKALEKLDLELFEEPGELPAGLRGALPLALDESLQGLDVEGAEARLRAHQARFVVLKPMAIGGLTHCLRLAERAQALGLGVVISHCFEGQTA